MSSCTNISRKIHIDDSNLEFRYLAFSTSVGMSTTFRLVIPVEAYSPQELTAKINALALGNGHENLLRIAKNPDSFEENSI